MKPQLLAVSALLLSAAPALADTITVTGTLTTIPTVNGFTTNAIDYTGMFGPAGASLSGHTFTVAYDLETGYSTPFISASITINDITVPIGTAEYGAFNIANSANNGGFPVAVYGRYPGPFTNIYSYALESVSGTINGVHSQINTEFDSGTPKIPTDLSSWSVTFDPAADYHLLGPISNPVDGAVWFQDDGVTTFRAALLVATMTRDNPAYAVPGPVAGAGLPGLGLLFAGLLVWCRRHR